MRGFFYMHHPTVRIAHTTALEHWLEREIAKWVHPMKDRSDDPSHHERMLLPRSYISLLGTERYSRFNTCKMRPGLDLLDEIKRRIAEPFTIQNLHPRVPQAVRSVKQNLKRFICTDKRFCMTSNVFSFFLI